MQLRNFMQMRMKTSKINQLSTYLIFNYIYTINSIGHLINKDTNIKVKRYSAFSGKKDRKTSMGLNAVNIRVCV